MCGVIASNYSLAFLEGRGEGRLPLKGDFIRPDQLCLPSSFILGYQFKEEEEEKRSQLSDVTCSPPRIYPWAESENLSFQSVLSIALKTNLFIKNQIRQGWGRGKTQQEHVFLLEESFNFTLIV